MSETLVIRLRAAEEAPASWLIVDRSGARSGPVHTGPLADALSLVENRSTVLLLPAGDVALAEPELPLRGGARLAQAVPFALEEQLASEVETLHFAVGTRERGRRGNARCVRRPQPDGPLAGRLRGGGHPSRRRLCRHHGPAGRRRERCTLLLDEGMLFVRRADGSALRARRESARGRARSRARRRHRGGRERRLLRELCRIRRRIATRSKGCARAPPRCR